MFHFNALFRTYANIQELLVGCTKQILQGDCDLMSRYQRILSGAKVIHPGMMSRTDNRDLIPRENILYNDMIVSREIYSN